MILQIPVYAPPSPCAPGINLNCCPPASSCVVATSPTFNLYTPWAVVKNFGGSRARTVTIEVKDGVLCAVVPGPVEGGTWDGSPRVFTLTCMRPDEEKSK